MLNFSEYKLDLTKEKEGVWFNWFSPIRIKLSRVGNPDYARELRKAIAEFRLANPGVIITDEQNQTLIKKALAFGCFRDWEGAKDLDTGEKVEFDAQYVYELMLDPAYYHLWEFAWQNASNLQHYVEQEVEDAVGNS